MGPDVTRAGLDIRGRGTVTGGRLDRALRPPQGGYLKGSGQKELTVLMDRLDSMTDEARARAERAASMMANVERTLASDEAAADRAAAALEASGRDEDRLGLAVAQEKATRARRDAAGYRNTATKARMEYENLAWMRDAVGALVKEVAAAAVTKAPAPLLDAEGFDLRPDPLAARTPAELVAALRRYREWAGTPSFRQMAAMARQMVAHSTLCSALGSDQLPRLDVVVAVIAGCGGGEEEQRRYMTAWRRITLGQVDTESAAAPALRALPAARAG